MSQIFYKDEATASARRVTVHLVDPFDGITPVTTEVGGQPTISKNGAATGNTSAVLVAIDSAKGDYYVELTAGELDTRGAVTIEYVNDGVVVAFEKTCSVLAGDAFTRLGAPAGASVSADVAAIKAVDDAVKAKTDSLTFTVAGKADANTTHFAGTILPASTVAGIPKTEASGGSIASVSGAVGSVTGAVGSVTGSVGSVTGNVGGNVTGSVGSVVGAVGSVTGAVGSVTGAVGSVTGNVGGNVTGSVGDVLKISGSATAADNLEAHALADTDPWDAAGGGATATDVADEIDRRHGQGRYGGAYPLSAQDANTRTPYGTLSNGWNCDDASAGLAASFGAIALVENGAPTYRVEGLQGPADFAVRVDSTHFLEAASNASFDAGAGDDVFLRVAMRGDDTDSLPQISKFGSGGSASGWKLESSGGVVRLIISVAGGGSNHWQVSMTSDHMKRGFVLVMAASRATAAARLSAMLADGTYLPGDVIDGDFPVGSLTNTNKFKVSASSGGEYSNVEIGVGVDAALGVPENIEAVTRAYWETVFGRPAVAKADVVKNLGADAPTPTVAGIPKVEDATVRTDTAYLITLGEESLYGSIDWDVKVPVKIEVPTVGTRTYRIEISGMYQDSGPIGVDANMTLALVNQAGVDRSARLDSTTMANPTYGTYRAIYTATAGDPDEQLLFRFTGDATAYTDTRAVSRWAVSVVEQEAASVDLTAVTDQIAILLSRLTEQRAINLDFLDMAISDVSTSGDPTIDPTAPVGSRKLSEKINLICDELIGEGDGFPFSMSIQRTTKNMAGTKTRTAWTISNGRRTRTVQDGTP